ncbi:protein phosphatase 1 regulatory subunit 12B-like isoform X2 [Cynoglossus semilaevis]|uniref:protein phosphatase 1 regulatory subunit 12B-like isoform X2 n=1 Tax=Cynoglossus semilaevis TaxID=244447 RepID=UPI000D630E46|nr:protein phosphatase 1 regulatory subunit 12B-like isoform X2 [Cynoglossus semilaevis]
MSVNQIFTEEILETSTVSVPITSSTMVHTSFIHTHTRPRSYLTPVRDEEAESQRRARSRHARQTRRSTQGVTLSDLREAQKTKNLSPPQDRPLEDGASQFDRSCQRKGFTDQTVKSPLTEVTETTDTKTVSSNVDEQGNVEPRCESLTESPTRSRSYLPDAKACGLAHCNTSFRVPERWWRDENQNPVEVPTQQHQRPCSPNMNDAEYYGAEHDRLSRYDSSGESVTEKPLGRTSSYTRRETRLAALNQQEQDSTRTDYKKMYAEALHENERLKSRLQGSKQELVKIRAQLEKVTQRQDRISERSSVLESEKREKQVLEKRVSDMEEELKVLTELKSDNQRLKDENGALIRVISKLSK